ncbi:unnamed protein product [Lactuca saligna]|uniref:Uncharacterized protein n=1 Tax=Lactuca saligna TaxID=75948 RepID=A0AA35Z4E0_LACSI|nr:unnamed protein product [Lactuca saligna]
MEGEDTDSGDYSLAAMLLPATRGFSRRHSLESPLKAPVAAVGTRNLKKLINDLSLDIGNNAICNGRFILTYPSNLIICAQCSSKQFLIVASSSLYDNLMEHFVYAAQSCLVGVKDNIGIEAIRHPNALHPRNVMAYDNAVTALGKICHFHHDSTESTQEGTMLMDRKSKFLESEYEKVIDF